jgi:hypothetical protein
LAGLLEEPANFFDLNPFLAATRVSLGQK